MAFLTSHMFLELLLRTITKTIRELSPAIKSYSEDTMGPLHHGSIISRLKSSFQSLLNKAAKQSDKMALILELLLEFSCFENFNFDSYYFLIPTLLNILT